MAMRASSLQATNTLAINREIDSKYDAVLQVRDKLPEIEIVAGMNIEALLIELEAAQDFTGISVVQGSAVAWDPIGKVLTVPKGDKGDTGEQGLQGVQGIQGIAGPRGAEGPKGDQGATGVQGPIGFTGPQGPQGIAGADGQDLTVEQIVYNGNGTFTWQFSDGTNYVTPSLMGPKGDTGDQGVKGDQGIGVHHIKGTSTTDLEGDFGSFGEIDTYTVYGDAAETINLGHFNVNNGATKEGQYSIMYGSMYDINGNGIVDNSERLGGELPAHYVDVISDQGISGNKVFADNVTIQGDLLVSGTTVTVDAETTTIKDNTIVVNSGEVGAGVTAGEAGIVVDRGLSADYKFVFDESSDSFKIGEEGSLQKVATREDAPISGGLAVWDSGSVKFNTTMDPTVDSVTIGGHTVGWNADEGTLDVVLAGATLQVGQEHLIRVRNNTASPIVNGSVVMATGTIGNSGRITVGPAQITNVNARYVLGVVTETIAAGADGFCTTFGKVRGIDTSGSVSGETWVDGDVLYVKDSGNGLLTKVVPTDTQVKLPIAIVVSAHATTGTLFVRTVPVDENHDKAELATKVTRPVSTTHKVVKFTDANGSIGDSNLVSNSMGDLGLNVSPNLWHTSVRALETAGGAVFTYGDTAFRKVQNAYMGLDGVYRYKKSAPASLYSEENGEHIFYTAPSGISAASVTFTERMRVANDGTLTINGNTIASINYVNRIEEW